MVDFRKWFSALAVIAVMLALTVPASAQAPPAPLTCTTNAGVPPNVRAEGLTELTGDVLLICSGGVPAGQPGGPVSVPAVNIEIFLNTNITSRLLAGNVSEAMLLIDEPAPANQRVCHSVAASNPTPGTVVPCTVVPNPGNPTGVIYNGPAGPGAEENVFLGEQAAPNRILWRGVPIDAPGTTASRIIRLTNVRANASQLGVSSTLIPSQIYTLISATSSTSIAINNPQQITGFVLPGMTFSVTGIADANTFLQCASRNSDLAGDPADPDNPQGRAFRVRFLEGFPSSFKVRVNGTTFTTPTLVLPQDTPGQIYNTESGLYNPALVGTCTSATRCAGLADTGTRLMARFNNVPAGISMFVNAVLIGRNSSGDLDTGGRALLVSTSDTTGAGGSVGTPVTQTSTALGGIVPVTISGGTGVAVWEVVQSDTSLTEYFQSEVLAAFRANTGANLPALGTSTASGTFAPISTVITASSSAPIPRFADTSTARNTFTINACSTNLLFPFVTNQSGFDTGMVISNTSQDPFGTAGQAGACRLNYYGGTTGGGAAPAVQTSGVVAAGAQLLLVVSTGGTLGIAGTPGFQGYVIAQCAFQYAHGFAFISDGPGGSARVAEGYLALVMDAGIGTRTGFASEVLAH